MDARTTVLLAAWALVGFADRSPSRPAGYFVAPPPTGSSDGTGSRARPWDLATGLTGGGGRVQPGDTVWLLGGTYRGAYRTELRGTAERPIVFRQHPGDRATIDGTLRADGAFLTFWGFEIMQSHPTTYGLQANTAHGRFINLVVHDAGNQGISYWTPAVDAELYGCIVYNNGTHENLDHGVYVHNELGTKLLADNIFFNNLARGIQVYASRKNPEIRNVRIEGNISFNNGTISPRASARTNLLVNAQVPTSGMVVVGNLVYFSGASGVNIRLGRYDARNNKDIVLQGNYAAGGAVVLEMEAPWDRAVVADNVLIGPRDIVRLAGAAVGRTYQWHGNAHYRDPAARAWRYEGAAYDLAEWRRVTGLGATDSVRSRPSTPQVFVRSNKYERGRAHIVVYNWSRQPTVPADLAGVLRVGDRYEVRNVQDFFGAPVLRGSYDGRPIGIPMQGVDPPRPLGGGRATSIPPRTGPEFDVFVLTRP
ncbi:MAG: right-handed parallel beta-helix repeat-containing protein [Gemmatimonadales bacterium]